MTYNELQTAVKHITATTGTKPANRKSDTLRAFIAEFHGTATVAPAPVETAIATDIATTTPATITVTATDITTEIPATDNAFGLSDRAIEIAADALVGFATIIAATVLFSRQCIAAGRRARVLSEAFASLYSELSYRLTHGAQLPLTDRADSAPAVEVLEDIALATVTAIANTGSVILYYVDREAIAFADRATATVNGIAESATAIASATASEFRIVRAARGAIALPAFYNC